MYRRTLCGLALLLASCGGDFTPYDRIDRPRVLALRADPPEIAFGEGAALDALVVAPSPTYAWSWCPLISSTTGYECLVSEEDVGVPLDLGSGETAELVHAIAPDQLEALCRSLGTITLPSNVSAPACDGGVDVSVLLTVTSGDDEIRATKDVRLSWTELDDATRNVNPEARPLRFRRDGVELPLDGSDATRVGIDAEATLAADIVDAQSQTYVDLADGATKRERLSISWFATAGSFDPSVESYVDGERSLEEARDVTWESPFAADLVSPNVDIYAVFRDDRGGASWSRGALVVGE